MYNFDKMTERRNTGALKWDEVAYDAIPMWVADMDFETAPEIRKALEERVAHGIFGYQLVTEDWYEAYIQWWDKRHGCRFEKEWMMFCTGVVPAISSTVRKLTTPGENVLIMTPVYNIFFNSIRNNGCNIVEFPLQYDGEEYTIDFEKLDRALANPQTGLMILCNPHNPVGKIWSREELAIIGELCEKNHVTVLSDEIHCDITDPGCEYVPYISASETCKNNCIVCIAPTKTFSIPGLQTAAIVVPNPVLRHKVNRAINTDEVAEPNSLAITAAVAAFRRGEEWLEELRVYLAENKRIVRDTFDERCPQVKIVPSKATYLLWLDCSALTDETAPLQKYLEKEYKVVLNEGEEYGKAGRQFLRLNTACPRERLLEGLDRLICGLLKYTIKD